MGMKTITPTKLRKSLYETLKNTIDNESKIEIRSIKANNNDDSVVIMSKREYEKLQSINFLSK